MGTVLGLMLEITGYAGHPTLSTTPTAEQPIVVGSAQPLTATVRPPAASSAEPPESVPAPAPAEQLPDMSTAEPSTSLQQLLPKARIKKPNALPPAPTAALRGSMSQSAKPASSVPPGGPSETSEFDLPARSNSTPPASSGRRRTLIYGGDELLRQPQ